MEVHSSLPVLNPHPVFQLERGGLGFCNEVARALFDTLTTREREEAVVVLWQHGMTALRGRKRVDADLKVKDRVFACALVPEPEGQRVNVYGTDVTERVRAEQQARAALAAKSTFLATMSHELRTPLNGLLGMVQLLEHRPLPAEDRELLQHMQQSGLALLSVVTDILDYSKYEAGKQTWERVSTAPRELLRTVVAALTPAAAEKGLTLSLELDDSLPAAVWTDPAKLRRVIENLVSNAIKFTSRGRVVLRSRLSRRGEWSIEVEDSGIGIAQPALRRLFAPFEQADASTTRRFGGTGLGLAIVKAIVEGLGGNVSVVSQQGVGSTFVVLVPVEAAPVVVARSERQLGRYEGLRVLVAEDNPVNQVVVRGMLQRLGAECQVVPDGAKAVEAVDAGLGWDLVLMDLHMPVMDGLEATQRILSAHPQLPIFAWTASLIEDERSRVTAVGMRGLIPKPLTLQALDELLRALRWVPPRHAAAAHLELAQA